MNEVRSDWSNTVEQAMEPTEFDLKMQDSPIFKTKLSEDGKLSDFGVIRERAARAYIAKHEGEEAEVEFTDPLFADTRNRGIWRVKGTLEKNYIRVPRFQNSNHQRTVLDGFIIDGTLVPFTGVSAIRVEGDTSVVVL